MKKCLKMPCPCWEWEGMKMPEPEMGEGITQRQKEGFPNEWGNQKG